MVEKRKPRSEMTHAEKIADHYRVIGRPNPFAFAHQGTPEQRKGGLGSNKGAARYESTSSEDRAKANSDGKFGYFDEVNKRYVPAFIDAMDGGGRDTRGDTFKGGPLSEILNNIGVTPYGSQRERAFGGPTTSPIQQAVSGEIPRPRVRPMQTMPDEVSGVPFNNTPLSMPDEVSGVPFNNTPPVMPDEVSGVPFNNTPNPFTGPTYDMPMPRPVEPSMNNVTRPSQFQNVFSISDFNKSEAALNAIRSFYRYADAAGIPKTDENFTRFQIEMY